MSTSTSTNSHGLARQFGTIPDGYNAFTMVLRPPATAAPSGPTEADLKWAKARQAAIRQNNARKAMTLAKRAALSLRTEGERKTDRAAALLARKAKSDFNAPISPPSVRGTSANARAKAGI